MRATTRNTRVRRRSHSQSRRAAAAAAATAVGVALAVGGVRATPRAVKSDIPFIKCQVCEYLADAAHEQYVGLMQTRRDDNDGGISTVRVRETDVIDAMEKMCDEKAEQGGWIITKDLQEKGKTLRVVDMGRENYGACGSECKTIVKACEDILGPRDTDVGEFLFTNADESARGAAALKKWLCTEETRACTGTPPALPKDRPKGEAFKPRDKHEVEMERMMASMQGMPGMGGAQMFSRDAMMRGMADEFDDDDDFEDSPYGAFDPSQFGGDASSKDDESVTGSKLVQSLHDVKEKASTKVKNVWNSAKSFFSRKGDDEEDDVEDFEFSAEELAKEEL